jgi:Tol biopolymer transport system component
VISTEHLGEGCSAFTEDGALFLFNRRLPSEEHKTIYVTVWQHGGWTNPSPAPFNSEYADWDFHFAPDGRTLFFTSKRPFGRTGKPSQSGNIWATKLDGSDWTPPRPLEYPINTPEHHDCGASLTEDGVLYFFSRREGGLGRSDIYRARSKEGRYSEVENLGKPINSEYADYDPFIAPDGSYLIFSSDRPGGYGQQNDMYISFQRPGGWTEPYNLGKDFGDAGINHVSLDGKYVFFSTGRTGHDDIYWVDAEIIETIGKKILNPRQ